ncbi:unnamed protein product, partial [Mycena citricolor]
MARCAMRLVVDRMNSGGGRSNGEIRRATHATSGCDSIGPEDGIRGTVPF